MVNGRHTVLRGTTPPTRLLLHRQDVVLRGSTDDNCASVMSCPHLYTRPGRAGARDKLHGQPGDADCVRAYSSFRPGKHARDFLESKAAAATLLQQGCYRRDRSIASSRRQVSACVNGRAYCPAGHHAAHAALKACHSASVR